VFGTLDARDIAGSLVGTLPSQMQDAWIAFARTGSPQTAQLPDWEPYTVPRRCTMLLDATSGSRDAPYEAERRFWELHAPASALHKLSIV
jgi:para-nitrobenzyl esterase